MLAHTFGAARFLCDRREQSTLQHAPPSRQHFWRFGVSRAPNKRSMSSPVKLRTSSSDFPSTVCINIDAAA